MSFLYDLRCHVKWGSTNSLIDLIESFEFLREAEVSDFDFECRGKQVYLSQKLLFLIFAKVSQFVVLGEVKHDVLELEVSMDN